MCVCVCVCVCCVCVCVSEVAWDLSVMTHSGFLGKVESQFVELLLPFNGFLDTL